MKTKQIIIFVGLFIVSIISFGGYIGVKILQKSIRSEIKNKIKSGLTEQELITFSFSNIEYNNLKWVKHDEFFYQGNLYDLVSEKSTDSNKTLKVISDKTEENLFRNLDQLMNNEISNNKGKEPIKYIYQFISKKFIQTNTNQLSIHCSIISTNHHTSNIKLEDNCLLISTPPPKI